MRLWHYKLIPFLPDSQLRGQWRELNLIFAVGKEKINHILINYVKDCSDKDLWMYSMMVLNEYINRGWYLPNLNNFKIYFFGIEGDAIEKPFENYHTERYLLQCFYNLQEKYDRGQKDFTKEQYEELEEFLEHEMQH